MQSTTLRVVAAVAGAGALLAAVVTSQFSFVVVALIAGLFLATSLSQAGRLTGPLQRFREQPVDVRVWGAPLPVPAGAMMRISSVKALSAGLHIFIRVGAGSPTHMKVAQPSRTRVEERAVTIESARYVQWSGRRLARRAGAPALAIVLKRPYK